MMRAEKRLWVVFGVVGLVGLGVVEMAEACAIRSWSQEAVQSESKEVWEARVVRAVSKERTAHRTVLTFAVRIEDGPRKGEVWNVRYTQGLPRRMPSGKVACPYVSGSGDEFRVAVQDRVRVWVQGDVKSGEDVQILRAVKVEVVLERGGKGKGVE